MRYLLVLDLAFAILGASMVIGVGVSALLLAVHLDTAPEQREAMVDLLVLTGVYAGTTLAAAAAAYGLHRRAVWHWAAQAALSMALVLSYLVSVSMLAGQ